MSRYAAIRSHITALVAHIAIARAGEKPLAAAPNITPIDEPDSTSAMDISARVVPTPGSRAIARDSPGCSSDTPGMNGTAPKSVATRDTIGAYLARWINVDEKKPNADALIPVRINNGSVTTRLLAGGAPGNN